MNSTTSKILKVALFLIIVFLGYKLYSIIQEPINYEKLKKRRYELVKNRLEQIRDAQKAFRGEYGAFADNLDLLIAFVDTGKVAIIERKDSTFTYFDKVYQQEMEKDTIIKKLLGYENVKEKIFSADFEPEKLRNIPFSEGVAFKLDAGKINVNDVVIPVFEAVAPDTVIFHDVLKRYDQYIDNDHVLKVGSMTEPTLSGNWK